MKLGNKTKEKDQKGVQLKAVRVRLNYKVFKKEDLMKSKKLQTLRNKTKFLKGTGNQSGK